MKFKLFLKDQLKGTIPQELLERLPSGFQRIGETIVLFLDKEIEPYQEEIGLAVKERFGVKAVFSRGKVLGELRVPRMKRIAGQTNITIHKENGCLFKIDVSKIMFAKGNVKERSRIVPEHDEIVLDMFSGIGQFSLFMAKNNPDCQIIAIEKNPVAVRFLKDNLRLNKIKNIEVIEGDCRDTELRNVADRIVMGYYPSTDIFLPTAFSFLRRAGVIHFHDIYKRTELWRKPLGILETKAIESGYKMEKILKKRIVKQYSPYKYHIVIDGIFKKR